jgi:predicted transcriptional regulator
MEENDDTSVANLVKTEDIKQKTKSDSIGIYANTLSVYILTIVSDLDEDVSENNKTITLDTGT